MDDDDDPVVMEYPVYMSSNMLHDLFVLQHPVRPSTVSEKEVDEDIVEVKYKPSQRRFSMKVALDTRSTTFDILKAEQLAANMPKRDEGDEAPNLQMMDYKMLEGFVASKDTKRYAIGRFHEDAVHLAPLDGWFHMRPSFAHVENKAQGGGAGAGTDDAAAADAAPEDAAAELVSIRFARHQTDRAKRAEQRSFAHLQKMSDSEPWVNLDFLPRHSEEAASVRRALLARSLDPVAESMDIDDVKGSLPVSVSVSAATMDGPCPGSGPELIFVEGLLTSGLSGAVGEEQLGDKQAGRDKKPATAAAAGGKDVSPAKLSLQQLRIRPLNERVSAVASRAKVIRYHEMCELMRPEAENDVMRGLMASCYLVQGCWVVRSDVLFKVTPATSSSSSSTSTTRPPYLSAVCRGVPPDIMARSRDYLLYNFTKSRVVDKSKMKSVLRLPASALVELLREFSRPADKLGASYEFIFPADLDFLAKYPDVAERQVLLWEAKFQQVLRLLKADQATKTADSSPTSSPRRRRQRTRSHRDSVGSDVESLVSVAAGGQPPAPSFSSSDRR